MHFKFQLSWRPPGKSYKGPEGFSRLGLRNNSLQERVRTSHIHSIEDPLRIDWWVRQSKQHQ